MGGRGSGRRSSYSGKPETNDSMPLDIRRIARSGLLIPGSSFGWQWTVNDRPVASIRIRVDWESLVLSYRMKSTGEVVEQRVQTQTTPCHLGGQRHWFACPLCSKRVAVVYAPGRYFACRQCCGLGYATQKESAGDRAATRADKLRKRLGGWHFERTGWKAQGHALENFPTAQKSSRCTGPDQFAGHGPPVWLSSITTGWVNLFSKTALDLEKGSVGKDFRAFIDAVIRVFEGLAVHDAKRIAHLLFEPTG